MENYSFYASKLYYGFYFFFHTFKNLIKFIIQILPFHLRNKYGLNSSIVVDCTDCPINRPNSDTQKQYYSGKSKRHVIKYQVAINLIDGTIVSVSAGFAGSIHDSTILRSTGLIDALDRGESVIADKAYVGNTWCITPIKGQCNGDEQLYNYILETLRIKVENVNCRYKNFGCLAQEWRHPIEYHGIVFSVLSNLINLDLQLHPIRQ